MADERVVDEPEPRLQDWFDDIAATLRAPHLAALAMVAIELKSGRLIEATPAARAFLDEPTPGSIDELAERGTVAAPDLDRFRRRARRWLVDLDLQSSVENATTWNDEVRLHSGGTTRSVQLHVLLHRRPRYGELAVVTLTSTEQPDDPTAPEHPERPTRTLWSILDAHSRVVAVDPGWEALWSDPQRTIGTLVSVLVHPDDLAEILPVAHELFGGRLPCSSYTVRLATDDGLWVPVHVEHRAMVTDGDLLVVAQNRIVDQSRRMILPGELTQREQEVVGALFDGLRVSQVAERHSVSVHTVRNQLRSVYKKLGATGQADLLARFHRPGGG